MEKPEIKPEDKELFERFKTFYEEIEQYSPALRRNEMSLEEVFYYVKSKMVHLYTETKFIEKPTKLSPEQLEYLHLWRERKKLQEAITDKEKREQAKIQKALERPTMNCFKCNSRVLKIVECQNPSYELETNKKTGQRKIIVISYCPFCKNKCRAFGGFL